MLSIAINGFGRIGKNFLRVLLEDKSALEKIKVAVINIGPADPVAVAHGFKYDTIMGTYNGKVSYENKNLVIDNLKIPVISIADPDKLDWKKYNIDFVVDASGRFTKRELAEKHIKAGAKKVLITAPAHGEDVTIIPGTNFELYDKDKHNIISLGSCTTNALTSMLKVVVDNFAVEIAGMTTVHAYTNTQVLLDVDATSNDLRRGRAAALNIVPTTTGAMALIEKVIPELKNKISGCSLRVPVATVSLIDLTVTTKKDVTVKLINDTFEKLSKDKNSSFYNIIDISYEQLVSSDYKLNSHSVTIDAPLTQVVGSRNARIFGWYDNEWGYSERLKDFLLKI